jgi:hypothetical protein
MKEIIEALDLAQCELRAMYNQIGIENSSVLMLIDGLLENLNKCNINMLQSNRIKNFIIEVAEWDKDYSSIRLKLLAKNLLKEFSEKII